MTKESSKSYHSPSALPSRKLIPPFESLRAFDAVARLGGVRKAALALYRDHAVVSRHLRTLENWTGCQLIERTPSGAVLTDDGQRYHQQIRGAIDSIADATVDLMRRNEDHSLQLWCMPGFALHWLIRSVTTFEERHPGIDLQLRSTHELPDFSRQEADVDIRMLLDSERPDTQDHGIQCEELASPPVIAVASGDYLAAHPEISHPSDLQQHQLLHEENYDNWHQWFEACGVDDIPQSLSGPRLWDGHMTLAAARRGRGIALSNVLVAGEDIEKGRLIPIGSNNPSFPIVNSWTYWFIARRDRWDSKAIRSFRQWLCNTIRAELKHLPVPATHQNATK